MRKLYIAPEAEIVRFAAEENLAADDGSVSFVGVDVTDQQDGYWDNWEKWFG